MPPPIKGYSNKKLLLFEVDIDKTLLQDQSSQILHAFPPLLTASSLPLNPIKFLELILLAHLQSGR